MSDPMAIVLAEEEPYDPAWRTGEHAPIVSRVPPPGAGNEISYQLPKGRLCKMAGFFAQCVASAVVLTRVATIKITSENGDTLYQAPAAGSFAATQTLVMFGSVYGSTVNAGNIYASVPLPNMWLPPGCTVATSTFHLDAGDVWDSIRLTLLLR